jgi:hypothetical protein
VQQLGIAASAICDSDCVDRIEVRAANVLTAALVRRVEELEHVGATAILVDITHNGAGSDWVGALPRALSSKPLGDSRLGFIKHEHWTTQLKDALRDVQADLRDAPGFGDVLRNAATTLERAIAASAQHCDRSDVWATGKLRCSLLVGDLLFSSGVLPDAPPGSLVGLAPVRRCFTAPATTTRKVAVSFRFMSSWMGKRGRQPSTLRLCFRTITPQRSSGKSREGRAAGMRTGAFPRCSRTRRLVCQDARLRATASRRQQRGEWGET